LGAWLSGFIASAILALHSRPTPIRAWAPYSRVTQFIVSNYSAGINAAPKRSLATSKRRLSRPEPSSSAMRSDTDTNICKLLCSRNTMAHGKRLISCVARPAYSGLLFSFRQPFVLNARKPSANRFVTGYPPYVRSGLKPARTSSEKSCGCSQAAKVRLCLAVIE